MAIKAHDMRDFRAFLTNCTDAQVIGVLKKEREANREEYAELALAECERRGLNPEE